MQYTWCNLYARARAHTHTDTHIQTHTNVYRCYTFCWISRYWNTINFVMYTRFLHTDRFTHVCMYTQVNLRMFVFVYPAAGAACEKKFTDSARYTVVLDDACSSLLTRYVPIMVPSSVGRGSSIMTLPRSRSSVANGEIDRKSLQLVRLFLVQKLTIV